LWAQSCARPSQPLHFSLAPGCCHPQPISHLTYVAHLPFYLSPPSAGAAVALCAMPRHAAPARPTPTPCLCLARLCSPPSCAHLGLLPTHWTIEDRRESNPGELSPSEPIHKNPNQTWITLWVRDKIDQESLSSTTRARPYKKSPSTTFFKHQTEPPLIPKRAPVDPSRRSIPRRATAWRRSLCIQRRLQSRYRSWSLTGGHPRRHPRSEKRVHDRQHSPPPPQPREPIGEDPHVPAFIFC
jgi:hypothetical protein